MKIIAQTGLYQCGECAQPLSFDQIALSEINTEAVGYCVNEDIYSNITGELLRKGCSRNGVKLRIPVQLIDCEIIK